MNLKLKLTAYAVLLILCAWFARGFYVNYSAATKTADDTGSNAPPAVSEIATNSPTNTVASANTNSSTNTLVESDTNVPAASETNMAVAADTNAAPAPTNTSAPAHKVAKVAAPVVAPESDASSKRSSMITYLAAFIGAVLGLGLLIAYDVTQIAGTQAVDFLFNDAGEGQRDPEYERAEAEWAKGKHLDAIQMMRDFVKKHPREIYASLRIAEIYEKDLRNYLAAALEYEEVLKHRLPAERWGWAAIHLCNLYSRLNKSEQAVALLRRIADDYPKTGAAKKARARLGMAEPEPEVVEEEAEAEAAQETDDGHSIIYMEERPPELEPRDETPAPEPEPTAAPEAPKPNLPPGFRKKK